MISATKQIISIIGFGHVGTAVFFALTNQIKHSLIHIMDPAADLSGRLLDLSHAAAIRNNEVVFNDQEILEQSEIIFFCAGYSNKTNESRTAVAHKNHELIHGIFSSLVFKTKPDIFVLTNPVEACCYWIKKEQPKARIIGTGTALDTFRLKFILSKKFNTPIKNIETYVIGEHGETMFPLWSLTRVNGLPLEIGKEEKKNITTELRNSAKEIRKTELATKYGVAQVAVELFLKLKSSASSIIPIAVKQKNSVNLGIEDGDFINLPTILGKDKYKVIHPNNWTVEELELLRISIAQIRQCIAHSASDWSGNKTKTLG